MTRDLAASIIAEVMYAHFGARARHDNPSAWRNLEIAHIVSQPYFSLHLAVHWSMLCFAVRLRDSGEIFGQIFRLVLVPLGSITGRLPIGNTGRANVSAFRTMPIPPGLLARMRSM